MPSYIHTKSERPLVNFIPSHHWLTYALRGNTEPKYQFAPGAQTCGLVRVGKNLVIGLSNKSLACYTPRVSGCHVWCHITIDPWQPQGKHLWSIGLPDLIATMTIMDHQSKMTQAGGSCIWYNSNCENEIILPIIVLVSLKNSEVRVYKDKYLVNSMNTDVSGVIMLF